MYSNTSTYTCSKNEHTWQIDVGDEKPMRVLECFLISALNCFEDVALACPAVRGRAKSPFGGPWEQSSDVYGCVQSQVKFSHRPCPEQLLGHTEAVGEGRPRKTTINRRRRRLEEVMQMECSFACGIR